MSLGFFIVAMEVACASPFAGCPLEVERLYVLVYLEDVVLVTCLCADDVALSLIHI